MWMKNKEKLFSELQETLSYTKRIHSCNYKEADKAVYFTQKPVKPIDRALIKEKAHFYTESVKFPDFKSSNGWIEKWKKQYEKPNIISLLRPLLRHI